MKAINWNRIEDDLDLEVWNRLVTNFWIPEKIPLSNDIKSWNTLTQEEKDTTIKVFTGLTMLDTIQGHIGADQLKKDVLTSHEVDVLNYIGFNESVHAKSYSSIFSTLCTMPEIDAAYKWSEQNKWIQQKVNLYTQNYYLDQNDPLSCKICSVLLESFLFYSGFYLPLYWSSRGKLTNTADIIRLIIRDEAVHGFYIGYKFQQKFKTLPVEQQTFLQNKAVSFMLHLMDIETEYTKELYSEMGLTTDVLKFLKYNANKAFMNLGFDPYYPEEETKVSPAILTALGANANETHDFFSGGGSSYEMAVVEATNDDDWEF